MLPTSQVYSMLGNETLWEAAQTSHELLAANQLSHAILGGVAVCLHGYQRNTVDIDLLVRPDEAKQVQEALLAADWEWEAEQKQLVSPSQCLLQLLIAGERAGKGADLRFPDPGDSDAVTELEGLPVLSLPRLIETKIACGMGNARRMHKDFADVVELIAMHHLQRSFARKLHKSVRLTFKELMELTRDQ